jgi:hypothetical protein
MNSFFYSVFPVRAGGVYWGEKDMRPCIEGAVHMLVDVAELREGSTKNIEAIPLGGGRARRTTEAKCASQPGLLQGKGKGINERGTFDTYMIIPHGWEIGHLYSWSALPLPGIAGASDGQKPGQTTCNMPRPAAV